MSRAVYGPDGWRVDADLTDAEKRMLESRLEELEKNPEKGVPYEEAQARLMKRLC